MNKNYVVKPFWNLYHPFYTNPTGVDTNTNRGGFGDVLVKYAI